MVDGACFTTQTKVSRTFSRAALLSTGISNLRSPFTGTLPPSWGSMTSLLALWLEDNRLSGAGPELSAQIVSMH
jgi:hypothetical protein